MRRHSHSQILGSCLLAALLFFGPRANAQMEKHATCPVMPGTRINEKFFVDYQGKRIYLCCRACVKAFKKNPTKYLRNLGS